MGAEVTVAGPRTMMPVDVEKMGVRAAFSLEEAIRGTDVVMMLRVQLERHAKALFPSTREYFDLFGLTRARLKAAKRDAIILHPGPMNRGVEIASDVADGTRSVNGVAVRMAVLYLLSGVHREAA
jgi:aspartate carbamoyltransferase catalytic subunit